MTRLLARAAIVAVVVFLGATAWAIWGPGRGGRLADCRGSEVAGGAATIGGPFTLVDQTGRTVTDADIITKPTLVYFGYTSCPDVCPIDMARNAQVADILEERGLDVTPVFISVDPKRDTPQVLAEYAASIHPNMVALTGTAEQVAAAAKAYKAYFKVQDDGAEYYLVDHTTFTYLMLPKTGFADFFRREATPEEMADRIACFAASS